MILMSRSRKLLSEPIYTRLPNEAMDWFEELRAKTGDAKSALARRLIIDRLVELMIRDEEAIAFLEKSGKAGNESGRQARMALESDLEEDEKQ